MLETLRQAGLVAGLAFVAALVVLSAIKATRHLSAYTKAKPQPTVESPVAKSSPGNRMWNTDPNRSIDEILGDIQAGSLRAFSQGSSNESFVLAPMAALLVRLSKDAEASSKRLEELTVRLYDITWFLLILTVGLFVLTAALLAKEGHDFYKNDYLPNQKSSETDQGAKPESATPGGGSAPDNP